MFWAMVKHLQEVSMGLKTIQKDIRIRVTFKEFVYEGEHDLYEVIQVQVMDEIPEQYDLYTKKELERMGIDFG